MHSSCFSVKRSVSKDFVKYVVFSIILFLSTSFFNIDANSGSIYNVRGNSSGYKEILCEGYRDFIFDNNILETTQQQKKEVKGKVTDVYGTPIIGANIIEKSQNNGTVTDIDGNFRLNVDEKAIIRVSYIGYLDVEVNTLEKAFFDIILEEDSRALDEVVVVGYGTQKKLNSDLLTPSM